MSRDARCDAVVGILFTMAFSLIGCESSSDAPANAQRSSPIGVIEGSNTNTSPSASHSTASQGSSSLPNHPVSTSRTSSDDPHVTAIGTRRKGEDWPRMLGVRFDSRSSETGIRTEWGKEGLKIVWTTPTGVGYGNGVVAQGRWFQFDRFGDMERLSCYNAETGEYLWKWEVPVAYRDAYGYNNGPRCSPVVDGNYVYVYGVTGTLACIHIENGREAWKREMNREYNVVPNFFGVGASPVVHQDLLLVMVGGSPKDSLRGRYATINDLPSATPDGTAMVALDKRTGTEIYRVGKYLASYSAPIIAPFGDKEYCVAMVREGLLVFDANDGSNESFFPWRAAMLESVNAASPVVIDQRIFISEAYEVGSALVAWRDGKLEPIWQDKGGRSSLAMRNHWATCVRDGNRLFGSSGRNPPDTDLRSIELLEGQPPKLRWTVRNRDRGTALIVDRHLLWLGETGKLQLLPLDATEYKPVAEMDMGTMLVPNTQDAYITPPSWAPPVLSHGLLYVRGADRVVCLELIPD